MAYAIYGNSEHFLIRQLRPKPSQSQELNLNTNSNNRQHDQTGRIASPRKKIHDTDHSKHRREYQHRGRADHLRSWGRESGNLFHKSGTKIKNPGRRKTAADDGSRRVEWSKGRQARSQECQARNWHRERRNRHREGRNYQRGRSDAEEIRRRRKRY